ncbi:MAG: DUF5132 domain-containing protein [Gammaproteobacteria bacterium]|jgi:hypothetical protein
MANGDFFKGFALGVAVAVAVPVVAIAVLTGGRPLARAASRGAGMLADKAREAAAETGEIIEDLIAESRADLDEARADPGFVDAEPASGRDQAEETSGAS